MPFCRRGRRRCGAAGVRLGCDSHCLKSRFVSARPNWIHMVFDKHPILALTSKGALANFLLRTGAGWVVDPKDAAGVLGAVRERYRQWKAGERGPVADPEIVASFDRRKLPGRLAELFDRLNVAPRNRPARNRPARNRPARNRPGGGSNGK